MKKALNFTIISDTHYYSKRNWIAGNYNDFPPDNNQLLIKHSEEIIKHTFDELSRNLEIDAVLISGDLSKNGEITSHEEMRDALAKLKKRGKAVYVITATHDYNDGFSPSYGRDENNKDVPVEGLERNKLLDYYGEFGYNDAISVHEESMSYVAQLADGYRLLALNDDYGNPHCGYSDDCFEWIREQVKKAHEDGQFIVAMTHHPIISPSAFYQLIGGANMLHQHELRAEQFADTGIPFILTGHSHIHNISSIKSQKGNILYDISTAALTGFPPVYRNICISPDDKKIDIESHFVDQVHGIDTNGLSLTDYTKKLFLGAVADAVYNAENDYDKFADFAIGMSISKETSAKYKFFFQNGAKFFNRLTFGKVWKLVRFSSGVSAAEIQPVYEKKLVPFLIDVAANLYKGDADMEKSSAEYRVFEGVLKKADKLAKPFLKKLRNKGINSISSMVLPLMHNDGLPDANAILYY
ncbi:MAG: metallophosphoesterase family protein [Eubacterium sp.]